MGLNMQIRFVHQDKPTPGQEVADVAVFDADCNPVDITGGAGTYDPVTVYDGRPMVGGRPGQDHIDPATGDLWSYEKTNENEPAAQAK